MGNNKNHESVRKRIIEKHENSINRDTGLAILGLAFAIGFFGSSAVLMPDQGSPTGLFSGDIELSSPVVEENEYLLKDVYNSGFSLALESEIRNPNRFQADLENVIYQVKSNGETIKRGVKDGSTVIDSPGTEWVVTEYNIDFSGVSDSEDIVQNIESGGRVVSVDGIYRFNVGGETLDVPFEKRTELD